jgi:hypothetical protein
MDAVLARMSGVFGGSSGKKPGTPQGSRRLSQNTVLQRVDGLFSPELFGAVLGRVAHAEGGLSAPERDRIRELLAQRFALRPPLLDWTVQAVEEAAGAQLDRQALLSEFNRVAEHDERIKLLDAAFAVAAADGEVSGPELEDSGSSPTFFGSLPGIPPGPIRLDPRSRRQGSPCQDVHLSWEHRSLLLTRRLRIAIIIRWRWRYIDW